MKVIVFTFCALATGFVYFLFFYKSYQRKQAKIVELEKRLRALEALSAGKGLMSDLRGY